VQHRHHRRPLTLREEAEMLVRYSSLQRAGRQPPSMRHIRLGRRTRGIRTLRRRA
jgi:hypothetical protein